MFLLIDLKESWSPPPPHISSISFLKCIICSCWETQSSEVHGSDQAAFHRLHFPPFVNIVKLMVLIWWQMKKSESWLATAERGKKREMRKSKLSESLHSAEWTKAAVQRAEGPERRTRTSSAETDCRTVVCGGSHITSPPHTHTAFTRTTPPHNICIFVIYHIFVLKVFFVGFLGWTVRNLFPQTELRDQERIPSHYWRIQPKSLSCFKQFILFFLSKWYTRDILGQKASCALTSTSAHFYFCP